MSSIQTGIELNDHFTSVIYGIINSVNMAVSAVEDMQQTMNSNVDTSGIQGIRDEINQATMAMDELNQAMQEQNSRVQSPDINTGNQEVINTNPPVQIPTPAPVEAPVIFDEPRGPPELPKPEPIEIPVTWQSDNFEVFSSTGVERFQQEIQSTNDMLETLNETQKQISAQASAVDILPYDAIFDLENLQARIQSVQANIEDIERNNLAFGTDEASSKLEQLRMRLSGLLNSQANLNAAMDGMDVGNINQAFLQLSQNVSNVERSLRDGFTTPVEIPVTWDTDGLDVFTSTGIDRFRQEVQSTNAMLEQLCSTQDSIARQAQNTNLFPSESFQDLNRLAVRIDMVRDRIQQIENNPVNMGTDTANAELERLRSQLHQAIQEQNNLNAAMQNMDVRAANDAYLRLSQTIGNTERYIRDNIDEQNRFNQEISEGITQADNLMNIIKGVVGTYVSIQAVGDVLNISDELVQTTSRLNMMNDGLQSTDEMMNMVYAAAQDARGSFGDMANVVAKFGNNAGDAFSSSAEVVAFANLVQKQMTIAGASTTEASNAMLQLSQGLGSGVLRGDELNSIFEQAPNLIQNIADYLEVPIGTIRDMASEGQLSADVVKAAIFAASNEINAEFESMPMTWRQIWQSMQNTAIIAFRPVLQRINQIANSDGFQDFANGAIEAMATLASVALNIFDLVASLGSFIADNWSFIEPIIYAVTFAMGLYTFALAANTIAHGVNSTATAISTLKANIHAAALARESGATFSATAAQYGFNTALLACPLTWILVIIIAVIAAIYVLIAAINEITGASLSATGVIFGAIMVLGAMLYNTALGALDLVLGIINFLVNPFIDFANFLANVFENPISSIIYMFQGLADNVLGVLENIASAIDSIFGSNLSGAIAGFRTDLEAMTNEVVQKYAADENYQQKYDKLDLSSETLGLDRLAYGDAFSFGYETGEAVDSAVSDFNLSDIFGATDIPNPDDYTSQVGDISANTSDISDDTGNISDALDITSEELKYLRDIAEQEAVNKFTTAEIKVQMTNHNNISSDMDLDGVLNGLTDAVNEAVDNMAEGVHE